MALGVPVDRVITKYGKGAMNKDKLWAALQECGIVSNIMVFSEFVHTGWYFVTGPSKHGSMAHQLLVHVDVDYGCSGMTVLDPLQLVKPDMAYAPDGSDLRSWSDVIAFVPGGTLKDELPRRQQDVNDDAQALVDALLRGESADAYCGYGRDGQATNYRDELKFSLRALQALQNQSS